ncbi:hypothetical protein BJ508DRAFT_327221 [Ascobolus immersus RN42]|uniref:Uncharacterized protein n=1 Tax=Ascobolus immersus RN42 TaxID=1160509 RepID=A0A3N4I8P3_ASCIM|nr:hypothetical protein BJ508DRAFT_327221 [Ascobolus immersus RN42]
MSIFQGSPTLHDKSDYQPWKDTITMETLTLVGATGLVDGTGTVTVRRRSNYDNPSNIPTEALRTKNTWRGTVPPI